MISGAFHPPGQRGVPGREQDPAFAASCGLDLGGANSAGRRFICVRVLVHRFLNKGVVEDDCASLYFYPVSVKIDHHLVTLADQGFLAPVLLCSGERRDFCGFVGATLVRQQSWPSVEFPGNLEPRPEVGFALFDFDGTLSIIRQGWPEIMVPMFLEALPTLPGESVDDVRRLVTDDIMRLNGKQTIYQMIQLAERIRHRGGEPNDPLTYKHEYLRRLDVHVASRKEGLRQKDGQPRRSPRPRSPPFPGAPGEPWPPPLSRQRHR